MEAEQTGHKLFVGGLSWETSDAKLRQYFEAYGEVIEAPVMKDKTTTRSRGFGFVVFKDLNVAQRVAAETHTIDGRPVEAKIAEPKSAGGVRAQGYPRADTQGEVKTKKIFVGGLAPHTDEAAFKEYFEQFGGIEDVVVMYDQTTQRPRGFGFVTFESEDAVDRVFQVGGYHDLHDRKVEIKRAVPKDRMPDNSAGGKGGKGSYGKGVGGKGGAKGGGYGGGGYGSGYGQMPVSAYGYDGAAFAGYGMPTAYSGMQGFQGGMEYMGYPGRQAVRGDVGVGYGGTGFVSDAVSPFGAYGSMVAAQYGSAAAGAGYTNDDYSTAGSDMGYGGRYGATTRDTGSAARSERKFFPY